VSYSITRNERGVCSARGANLLFREPVSGLDPVLIFPGGNH
jgi:hypothetical protein